MSNKKLKNLKSFKPMFHVKNMFVSRKGILLPVQPNQIIRFIPTSFQFRPSKNWRFCVTWNKLQFFYTSLVTFTWSTNCDIESSPQKRSTSPSSALCVMILEHLHVKWSCMNGQSLRAAQQFDHIFSWFKTNDLIFCLKHINPF